MITTWCLPASLVLLLLSVDIKAILHLGKTALAMMAFGAAGIMLGAPLVVLIYKDWLPPNAWMGIGALSASWIGGSANMIAVKEAIGTPDDVFLPAVIVDTIVPYMWMGMLIAMSAYQAWFDKLNKSNVKLLDELHAGSQYGSKSAERTGSIHIILMMIIAITGSIVSHTLALYLPEIKGLISATAWSILIATFIGIAISFTAARRSRIARLVANRALPSFILYLPQSEQRPVFPILSLRRFFCLPA